MRGGTRVTPEAVRELRQFKYDNTPTYLRGDHPVAPATDDEVRRLLVFAARYAKGDPTVPRNLEARRVISLVPEDVGAALFRDVAPGSIR